MESAEDVPSAAIEGRDGEERSLVDRNIFAHDVRAVEEIVGDASNPQPPVRRVVVVNRQPADVHVFAVRDRNSWPAQWVLKDSSSIDTAAPLFSNRGPVLVAAASVIAGVAAGGVVMFLWLRSRAPKQAPLLG